MTITAEEYAELLHNARNDVFNRLRAALPEKTQMKMRFLHRGKVDVKEWAAPLINPDTKSVRLLVLLINSLGSADLEKTQGARNFNPEMKISLELYHDQPQGTDADNSQIEFELDAFKIQFAVEQNRALPPKGKIMDFNFSLGILPSSRPLHYGRGEIVINFRDIRV